MKSKKRRVRTKLCTGGSGELAGSQFELRMGPPGDLGRVAVGGQDIIECPFRIGEFVRLEGLYGVNEG